MKFKLGDIVTTTYHIDAEVTTAPIQIIGCITEISKDGQRCWVHVDGLAYLSHWHQVEYLELITCNNTEQ